jgi:hypothetical protein
MQVPSSVLLSFFPHVSPYNNLPPFPLYDRLCILFDIPHHNHIDILCDDLRFVLHQTLYDNQLDTVEEYILLILF